MHHGTHLYHLVVTPIYLSESCPNAHFDSQNCVSCGTNVAVISLLLAAHVYSSVGRWFAHVSKQQQPSAVCQRMFSTVYPAHQRNITPSECWYPTYAHHLLLPHLSPLDVSLTVSFPPKPNIPDHQTPQSLSYTTLVQYDLSRHPATFSLPCVTYKLPSHNLY